MVTDVATMLIAGPECGPRRLASAYLVHNDDPNNEIYIEVTPAIIPAPGSPHCVLPPNSAIALTGAQTMWARCADGKTAQVHVVPSIIYGTPGSGGVIGTAG